MPINFTLPTWDQMTLFWDTLGLLPQTLNWTGPKAPSPHQLPSTLVELLLGNQSAPYESRECELPFGTLLLSKKEMKCTSEFYASTPIKFLK